MANPYVFGGSAFPYEEMPFPAQTYSDLEDGQVTSAMTCIDPYLQSLSPTLYGTTWAAPVQPTFKQPSAALFVGDIGKQTPNHTLVRTPLGVPPVPAPSQVRFASPISSIEPSPSGSASSPRADTESYYDSFPRTPPDTAVLSPFQPPLQLEPYAHAVQFRDMGPKFVNPFELNPSQQPEYCESDSSIIDFSASQSGYSFDMHASRDVDPLQSAAVADFTTSRANPEQTRPTAKRRIEASSQYPPPPKEEDMGSDDDVPVQRQNGDEADGDYQPPKRQRTATRAPRRAVKAAAATATATSSSSSSSSSRRTRNQANNVPTGRSLTSTTNNRTSLTCPHCKGRNFASQVDLDAHIKKQHARSFNCVFDFAGCTSTFATKNEWKRHVSTQHLLLDYWVCTEGACATPPGSPSFPCSSSSSAATPSTNPSKAFNRKDLFTQHLKRMHVPRELKEYLPSSSKGRAATSSASHTATKPTPAIQAALAQWESRLKRLQASALRPRCPRPNLMRCPVRGCAHEPFRGQEAWNHRMEHVAKHMEGAAQGTEPPVVFGGAGDPTLVDWAARRDVAIIIPATTTTTTTTTIAKEGAEGEREAGDGEWVLNEVLKRSASGGAVVTTTAAAPVRGGGIRGLESRQEEEEEEEEEAEEAEDEEEQEQEEEEEIVVYSSTDGEAEEDVDDGGQQQEEEEEEEEEDAEGEEDDC